MSKFELPPVENHGWAKDYEVKWTETALSEDLMAIIVKNDLEEDIYEENDESSDEDDGKENWLINFDGYHCHWVTWVCNWYC